MDPKDRVSMSAVNHFTTRTPNRPNPEVDAIVASARAAGISVEVTEDEGGTQRADLNRLSPLEVDVIYAGIKASLESQITEMLRPTVSGVRRSA